MGKSTKIKALHRGRFQAQGGKEKLNKKEPWNELTPLLYTTGKKLLNDLKNQLTPKELSERTASGRRRSSACARPWSGRVPPRPGRHPCPGSRSGARLVLLASAERSGSAP